jgi:hypothetical protein
MRGTQHQRVERRVGNESRRNLGSFRDTGITFSQQRRPRKSNNGFFGSFTSLGETTVLIFFFRSDSESGKLTATGVSAFAKLQGRVLGQFNRDS